MVEFTSLRDTVNIGGGCEDAVIVTTRNGWVYCKESGVKRFL